ncbi:hypothetical protein [Vacuolonema iberomarrocanum]|uniref:hypothetical protein n=1 Tax=Vacuolonema iberomarrocanum TaxID=3454632 RepID=UPI0019F65254|nr:hypothetical protein [filamentous cyanobacterium LEGE 07170]
MLRRMVGGAFILGIVASIGLAVSPAIAQSNFGSLTLAPGFSANEGTAQGRTGGNTSLPASVAERDRNGDLCLGYGSATPDYLLNLTAGFEQLTLRVNGGGTTLIVQGPGGVLCGDGQVSASGWAAGEYQVWVGTGSPGERSNYTLRVSE